MIICSCLNITTSDIQKLMEERVVSCCRDVYTEFSQGRQHTPCSCCPKEICNVLEEK